ncbi:MAG: hypothetical protein KJ747_08300 [Actinobacteria bacterium]|nr:hypothetical protein [Actinomycetota bacterium]MCG2807658.1 hypothetical protein [Coriobacteriia bacterium]
MRNVAVRVGVSVIVLAALIAGAGCTRQSSADITQPSTSAQAEAPSPEAVRASQAIAALNARVAEYPADFTDEQAVATVLAFDPTATGAHVLPAPSARGPDPSARLEYTFVQVTPSRGYVVEGRSGNVTEVWGRVPASVVLDGSEISVPLSKDEARALAEEFLTRVRPGFEYLTPTDWGENWYVQEPDEFGFGWELVDAIGTNLGDRVRVSIDRTTGEAVQYVSQEGGPISISTTPSISAEEAMQSVLGHSDTAGVRAHLRYVGYPFPYERLSWLVDIPPGPDRNRITGRSPDIASPVVVEVDAHTGAVVKRDAVQSWGAMTSGSQ